jgi:quercetin dioxygenase-like cupin family protein
MTDSGFRPEENLATIRALTESNTVVPLSVIAHVSGVTVSYDCLSGSCVAQGLFSHPHVGALVCDMAEGTVLAAHVHPDSEERLTVLDGAITVELPGAPAVVYSAGSTVTFPPGTRHVVRCQEATRVFCVIRPWAEGYPHV